MLGTLRGEGAATGVKCTPGYGASPCVGARGTLLGAIESFWVLCGALAGARETTGVRGTLLGVMWAPRGYLHVRVLVRPIRPHMSRFGQVWRMPCPDKFERQTVARLA